MSVHSALPSMNTIPAVASGLRNHCRMKNPSKAEMIDNPTMGINEGDCCHIMGSSSYIFLSVYVFSHRIIKSYPMKLIT